MGAGFPLVKLSTMAKWSWNSKHTHFIGGVRRAFGAKNLWLRSEWVSKEVRAEALRKTLEVIPCVDYEAANDIDTSMWAVGPEGLLVPQNVVASDTPTAAATPTAWDFILFAAIYYHVSSQTRVQIQLKDSVVFDTATVNSQAVIDFDSADAALPFIACQFVRRPPSQSTLRNSAQVQNENEDDLVLKLDQVPKDTPMCWVDFHSYASPKSKVTASLNELAAAYHRVSQHLKLKDQSILQAKSGNPHVAYANVGQSLWIGILGGGILDSGRITFQKIRNPWAADMTEDEAYINRIETVLDMIRPVVAAGRMDDILVSGGITRLPAIPFLLAGLFGQMLVAYFLAVGTSAGVWTSVALANSLFAGKLTDLHSIYLGKTPRTQQPGMKMYVPNTENFMVIATFDRSAHQEGALRPGFLANACGLLAAIFGAAFQSQTRAALGFADFTPSRPWVVYTTIFLTLAITSLVVILLILQYRGKGKEWQQGNFLPDRWMVYSTLPSAVVVSGLALVFRLKDLGRFWPILDAITWLSGIPLGAIENGRLISVDENTLQLILVIRWLMGAVASALGSGDRAGGSGN